MNKADRIRVWEKYDHHCAYCGKILKYEEMEVDHFIPQRLAWWFKQAIYVARYKLVGEIHSFSNLMPSCHRCNHYKRSELPENFRTLMKTLYKRIMEIYICKVGDDYGILRIEPWDGLFYFEKHKNTTNEKTPRFQRTRNNKGNPHTVGTGTRSNRRLAALPENV